MKKKDSVKRHMSVFLFFVRSSFYKIALVLGVMAAAESLWFIRTRKMMEKQQLSGEVLALLPEVLVEKAGLRYFFSVALLAVVFFLLCIGRSSTGHSEYTLYRLRISPRSVFVWQSVYNICCFFILWGVQVLVLYGLCGQYIETAAASAVTHQSLYLAFYRSEFLHTILPLNNVWGWIWMVLWLILLGVATARELLLEREGKHSAGLTFFAIIGWNFLSRKSEERAAMIFFSFVFAAALLYFIFRIFVKEEWKLDGTARKS